jgi:hypothetical protein
VSIAYHHRVTAVGMNRSGKSEILRHLFVRMATRRVLIDPKGEWVLAGTPMHQLTAIDPGQARAEIEAIDWSAGVVHVQPAWQGAGAREARAQLAALYERIARIAGPCTVWTDEAYGVSSADWTPAGLFNLLVAGAGRGHGHLAATQRPRNVATELFSEADHLFVVPPLAADDFAHVLRQGAPFYPLEDARADAADLPEHGYLYVDRRSREVLQGDPLPRHMLEAGRQQVHKRGERGRAPVAADPQPDELPAA